MKNPEMNGNGSNPPEKNHSHEELPDFIHEFVEFDGDDDNSWEDLGVSTITLVDEETGEEYQFLNVYDFPFEDEVYYVLLSLDEGEPEALFARFDEDENGQEIFVTVNDDEFDRVAAEYERLCNEMDDDDELF